MFSFPSLYSARQSRLKSIGKYIIDGIVGGIKNSLSKIANVAGKIKDTLLSKLKGLFKIASYRIVRFLLT